LFVTTEIFNMRITALLSSALPGVAMAASSQTTQSSAKDMASFWIDPAAVLDQLDEYQALWIKPHGCV
jgi:hypothetical protein